MRQHDSGLLASFLERPATVFPCAISFFIDYIFLCGSFLSSLLSFLNHFGVWSYVSGLFLPPLFCGFAFLCGGFPPGVI